MPNSSLTISSSSFVTKTCCHSFIYGQWEFIGCLLYGLKFWVDWERKSWGINHTKNGLRNSSNMKLQFLPMLEEGKKKKNTDH